MRSRRGLTRRLNVLATRLEPAGATASEGRNLERTVERLERAIADRAAEVSEAISGFDRLAGALAEVADGVLVCDEHGHVVYRNETASELTDTRHGETLPGRTLSQLLDAALEGTRGRRTVELLGPPRRTLTITASPLDDGHRAIGAVAVITDMSERRRLEAFRRDLVANMQRALRVPVATIAGLAETLTAEGDRSMARRLAERIASEADRAARTVDDLLELSVVEAEESPRRDAFVLADMVTAAIAAAAGEERVEVVEAVPRLRVVGDRRQLVTAVQNLVDNALRYSESERNAVVELGRDGTWVTITVRDEGVGIPLREVDRVFERFYRGELATQLNADGTGLGLAVTRHIARAHGGDVVVESRPNEGSTFTLRVPAAPGAITLPDAAAG